MTINDFAVYFIEERALFGAYPTQERIELLERWGVDLIVDLTVPNEKKCVQYETSVPIIKFPIPDRQIPKNKYEFCKLILIVSERIDAGQKVFIHCKGGHGRSGMFVAALLCFRGGLSSAEALSRTTECHATRIGLKPYWLKVGSPQTWEQKQLVHQLFRTHTITETSPFFGDVTGTYIDAFLIQTYLGNIVGPNGKELEDRRRRLFLEEF